MTHDEHYDLMLHALHQIDRICCDVYEETPAPIAAVFAEVHQIAHATRMVCGDIHQDWIDGIAKCVDESARILMDEFYADRDALKNATWTKGGRMVDEAP